MKYEKGIFLVAQKNAQKDEPQEADIYRVGTVGIIIQLLRLPDGTVKVLVEGKRRGAIREYLPNEEFFMVRVEEVEEAVDSDAVKAEALMRNVRESFETYVKLSKKVHVEIVGTINAIDDPAKLADVVVSHLNIKLDERQKILEIFHVNERLENVYERMISEIEILQVEEKIKRRVKKQMEKTQKDYYLNEQMRAIQKEMGEKDDLKNEIAEIESPGCGQLPLVFPVDRVECLVEGVGRVVGIKVTRQLEVVLGTGNGVDKASQSITEDGIKEYIAVLASDDFQGRFPGTLGEEKTIHYLSEQFSSLGLLPGNGDSYFQEVPLMKITPETDFTLNISGKKGSLTLQYLSLIHI